MGEIHEVVGLGKGLGSIGAKMSKSAGMAGMDVTSNVKPKQPPQPAAAPAEQEAPSEEEAAALAAEEGPEMVEKLPKAVKMEYDKLGAPDKHKLLGHIVRRDGKDYVLDWDEEFEVYKLVDPETYRVKTRVRPASVSTVDFRSGTVREALEGAVFDILDGDEADKLVDKLLYG